MGVAHVRKGSRKWTLAAFEIDMELFKKTSDCRILQEDKFSPRISLIADDG